jgi:hypothetical protein
MGITNGTSRRMVAVPPHRILGIALIQCAGSTIPGRLNKRKKIKGADILATHTAPSVRAIVDLPEWVPQRDDTTFYIAAKVFGSGGS